MGANEKHAATFHGGEYTPTLDDLRDLWVDHKLDPLPRAQSIELVPTVQAEFDRWLAKVRAEAKAEALNEAADEVARIDGREDYAARDWLRAHAEQIRERLLS